MSAATVAIERVRPIIGMEVHVELATRTKMFSASPNVAHADYEDAEPNTLIDTTNLGLPGALPVPNRAAVEMSMLVGMALECSIADETKWDRKSYFYPDLPKGYQISQYDLPLCFDGAVDLPAAKVDGDEVVLDLGGHTTRIGIIRAHLEEDAGKLAHEGSGGRPIDGSIVDLNRAGTPLLEIVTAPDFTDAAQCVVFARLLRQTCRFLGVTRGIMQQGHMRFEPNINCELVLEGGKTVRTPITEVKNLNSFRALRGAIEHEIAEQPRRWLDDGVQFGPGTKSTRGWDDVHNVTVLQRSKEDAHDYRYFPDPDLPALHIDEAWRERVRAQLPQLPLDRLRRLVDDGVSVVDAQAIVDERALAELHDAGVTAAVESSVGRSEASKTAANVLRQQAAKLANERGVGVAELGFTAGHLGDIVRMLHNGVIASSAVEPLLATLSSEGYVETDAEAVAEYEGLLTERDESKLAAWCDEAIAEDPETAEAVRAGNQAAVGRLIGAVMKKSGGSADAKAVRGMMLSRLS